MEDAVIVATTLVVSFFGALLLQKAALSKLFRLMNAERRARQ